MPFSFGRSISQEKGKERRLLARKPALEPLEVRCVPSAALPLAFEDPSPSPLQVVLICDAIQEPERVAGSARHGVLPIVFPAVTTTSDGLVALLEGVSAGHGGAPIVRLGLVAHGDAGRIALTPGATWNSEDWTRVGNLLSPQAQLDLYVCNLAAGPEG